MLPPFFLKLFLVVTVLLSVACSSIDEEEELGPAELIEFDAEMEFNRLWSQSVGDGQGDLYNRLRPAIDGNMIVVASADGEVEAFTLKEGDSLWDTELDFSVSGAISIIGDNVYVGTLTGDVIALSKETGKPLWQTNVHGEVLSAPAGDGERIFVQTLDDQLIALNATSGEREWSYRNIMPVLTLRGTSSPLYNRGMVAAGFANGKVVAFKADNGSVLWDARVASSKGSSEIERIVDIDADLLLEDGSIYVVSYQGAIAAIDPANGSKKWTREESSYVSMGYGFNNVYVAGQEGSVTAFANNGQGVRWEQTVLSRRQLTGPVTLGNYVVVGDIEGYLHALSQIDGHMVARKGIDSDGLRSRLISHNDVLYVYSNSGTLAAYTLVKNASSWF
ncbi:MAG: outer membrane protein assembly factor BamB [Pseudohongiellaceae bacterium]|jgi:outer membrane protein assembly factor BamB